MAVWTWQDTDGARAGPEVVIPPRRPGQPDAELLAVKAASHLGNGWKVVSRTPTAMHLFKLYDPATQGIGRKDRYFEIRG